MPGFCSPFRTRYTEASTEAFRLSFWQHRELLVSWRTAVCPLAPISHLPLLFGVRSIIELFSYSSHQYKFARNDRRGARRRFADSGTE